MNPEALPWQWVLPFALRPMSLVALRLKWVLPRRLPLPRRLERLMLGVLGTLDMLGRLGMLAVLGVLGVLGVCGT